MPKEQIALGRADEHGDAHLAHPSGQERLSNDLDELVSDFILELRILSQELGVDEDSLRQTDQTGSDTRALLADHSGCSVTNRDVDSSEPNQAPEVPAAEWATEVSEPEKEQLREVPVEVSQSVNPDNPSQSRTETEAPQDPVRVEYVASAPDGNSPVSAISEPLAAFQTADERKIPENDGADLPGPETADVNLGPHASPGPLDAAIKNDMIPVAGVQQEQFAAGHTAEELHDIDSALRNMVLKKPKKRRWFLFLL